MSEKEPKCKITVSADTMLDKLRRKLLLEFIPLLEENINGLIEKLHDEIYNLKSYKDSLQEIDFYLYGNHKLYTKDKEDAIKFEESFKKQEQHYNNQSINNFFLYKIRVLDLCEGVSSFVWCIEKDDILALSKVKRVVLYECFPNNMTQTNLEKIKKDFEFKIFQKIDLFYHFVSKLSQGEDIEIPDLDESSKILRGLVT